MIENVWTHMVQNWQPFMARSHKKLQARVGEAWKGLRDSLGYLQTLTDSMPRRLQKLLDVGRACIHSYSLLIHKCKRHYFS